MTRRVAIKIAYLGADFYGSQYQPGLRTVVGDIVDDLHIISPEKDTEWFDIKPSSRTDAGVNALGNVIAINTEFSDNFSLLKALNSVSKSIFYRSIADVNPDFNPRFADERIYKYILPSKGIDIKIAKECASLFLGEHDFIRFCKAYEDKPTITSIDSINIIENDDYLELTFRSNYFLWNMIRKICAAISSVGKGERSINDVKDALSGKDVSFGIVRPDALTLMDVIYKNIDFKSPPADAYKDRLNDDLFINMLNKRFLSSLQ